MRCNRFIRGTLDRTLCMWLSDESVVFATAAMYRSCS